MFFFLSGAGCSCGSCRCGWRRRQGADAASGAMARKALVLEVMSGWMEAAAAQVRWGGMPKLIEVEWTCC